MRPCGGLEMAITEASMPDFRRRSFDAEIMDDPTVGDAEMRATLLELERINRRLGGYSASLRGLDRLARADPSRRLRILDVGTGGGDVARAMCSWGRRRAIDVEVHAIDLLESCIEFARERRRAGDAIDFEVRDVFALPVRCEYDIVHASLVLHHFDDETAARALGRFGALARVGVVINDLERHPVAYHSIRALTAAFSRSRLIRHDAPLSVLRGFRREELATLARRGGLERMEIRWRWAFRWLLVARR